MIEKTNKVPTKRLKNKHKKKDKKNMMVIFFT